MNDYDLPSPLLDLKRWAIRFGLPIVVVLAVVIGLFGPGLIARQKAVTAFWHLIYAVNQGNTEAVRSLCSKNYLATHSIEVANGGGVVGMPRDINKNFQVWQSNSHVHICPSNRDSHFRPVYQLVKEDGAWKFDGPVGILREGRFVPSQ